MPIAPLCDAFVACGETSGDAYAAEVVRGLRAIRSDLVLAAMGGPQLAAAGAEIEQDIDGLSVMGLWPVLARLGTFMRIMRQVERTVRARRPRVLLTVDYPGFNLRLARRLADMRREGMRAVHVVAPQVWAWRPRRAKAIAASVDRLLCFFPFEPALFNRFGCRAEHIGHPLVDLVPQTVTTSEVDSHLGIGGRDLLLVAPGSREREVRALLPVLAAAAQAFAARIRPQPAVVVSRVPELPLDLYRTSTDLPLVEGRWHELCARARVGMLASGTATLEAGLIGLPHVITYRTDDLTARCARHLLISDHVGLPNLVCQRRVCPEVLQDELTVPRLVAHLHRLWEGPRRDDCLAGLAELRPRLGGGGALARIVDVVAEEIHSGHRKFTHATAADTSARLRAIR